VHDVMLGKWERSDEHRSKPPCGSASAKGLTAYQVKNSHEVFALTLIPRQVPELFR
jgi:hypothetical protein